MPETDWRPFKVTSQLVGQKTLYLKDDEELCPTCKGAGHWDSCFDCGNRGFFLATEIIMAEQEARFLDESKIEVEGFDY